MAAINKNAPSAVVGLDIGSDTIKVSEARMTKDGIVITAMGIAPTPPGVIEDDVVIDHVSLGAAIKDVIAGSGIKTKKCVSSISGQSKVVVRVIEVPKMEGKELDESMKWEVTSQVPFAATGGFEMDYAPIPTESDDLNIQTMDVLLAVAKQDVVESHVAALLAAGLKPYAIDINQLAAERSLIETKKIADPNTIQEQVIAILSIGAKNTEMGIFENGELVFPCPPIPIAGETLTNEIAESIAISPVQAEIMKKEYASVDLDGFGVQGAQMSEEPTAYDQGFYMPSESPFASSFNEPEQPAAQPFESEEAPKTTFDLGAELGFPQFGAEEETPEPESKPDVFEGFDMGGSEPAIVPSTVSGAFEEGLDQSEVISTTFIPDYDLGDIEAVTHPVAAEETEAVETKDEQAVAQVFQAISNVLVDLANEIRRSVEYYSVKYNNMPSKVYLCGGTAKIPNLAEFLSRELGIPVVVANPLENIPCQIPSMPQYELDDIAPLFVSCIGLAIRDMII